MTAQSLRLTILTGPHSGHVVDVPAGAPRTFGRGAASDVQLLDEAMSEVHFALHLDDAGAVQVRDLSGGGTTLNDRGVTDGAARDGDQLTAGATRFFIAVVSSDGPVVEDVDELSPELVAAAMQRSAPDCARWALQSEEGSHYALVDVANEPELLRLFEAGGESYCALDETRDPDDLGETAPVLAYLPVGTEFLAQVFDECWSMGNAVFFASDRPFIEVYDHVIRQLTWEEDGRIGGLRFWLPRVLAAQLPGTDAERAAAFFGPVRAFLVESEDGREALRFSLEGGAVVQRRIALQL